MTSSRLLLALLALGCVIAPSLAKPQPQKGDGKKGGGGGGGGDGLEQGTAEGIKEKPEDTKSYVNWGNTNFAGVQNIMDGHFMKKKKEGDQITKYGDHSRKENEVMQTKIEEGQYNTMYHSFKWAEGEMAESTKEAAKAEGDEGGDEEGGGAAPAAKPAGGGAKPAAAKKEEKKEAAATTAAPEPAAEPAAEGGDDDEE